MRIWSRIAVLSSCAAVATFAAGRASAEDPPAGEPAPAPKAIADGETQILAWIADLGSEAFAVREAASKRLAEAGEAAREALTAAARTSESLEVRWRAGQLLLRLEGQTERPMTPAPEVERPKVRRPGEPRVPSPGGTRPTPKEDFEKRWWTEIERFTEELRKRFGLPAPGLMPEGWPNDFPDDVLPGGRQRTPDPMSESLSAGALTLHVPLFRGGQVRLDVASPQGGGEAPRSYSGASLEALLEENPALREHPDMAALRAREGERVARNKRAFRLGGGPGLTFSFQSSSGLEVRQDSEGAVVRYQETGPDGQKEWKEVRGASLEEIKRTHPELAERLNAMGGFQLQVQAPRVIVGPRHEGLTPLAEDAPPAAPSTPIPQESFGVYLEPVDEVLASHLQIEPGHGLLVVAVAPGSQAQALGLARNDVLLSIDGTPIAERNLAVRALRLAARTKGALSLEIVRQGQRQTLTR